MILFEELNLCVALRSGNPADKAAETSTVTGSYTEEKQGGEEINPSPCL